jgi:hypothetical protein
MWTDKTLDTDLQGDIEREATTLSVPTIAGYLHSHLGQKITAYLAGIDTTKTVRMWISGAVMPRDLPKARLRYAYQAARMIVEAYDDETAKAWFFGSNTLLDDEAPSYVLRHGTTPDDLRLVIPAACNLVADRPRSLVLEP